MNCSMVLVLEVDRFYGVEIRYEMLNENASTSLRIFNYSTRQNIRLRFLIVWKIQKHIDTPTGL